MGGDPWEVAMVTPFICILPTYIYLLLALLTIGTYPPFSSLLINKLIDIEHFVC